MSCYLQRHSNQKIDMAAKRQLPETTRQMPFHLEITLLDRQLLLLEENMPSRHVKLLAFPESVKGEMGMEAVRRNWFCNVIGGMEI